MFLALCFFLLTPARLMGNPLMIFSKNMAFWKKSWATAL
jgi:hypothetical protein